MEGRYNKAGMDHLEAGLTGMKVDALGASEQQLVPLRQFQVNLVFLLMILVTSIFQSQASQLSRFDPMISYLSVCRFEDRQYSNSVCGPKAIGEAVPSLQRVRLKQPCPCGGVQSRGTVMVEPILFVSNLMMGLPFSSQSRMQSWLVKRKQGTLITPSPARPSPFWSWLEGTGLASGSLSMYANNLL